MKLQATSYKLQANPGFTLIEIMVSVSIFVVVAMITTGALITISDVNRKAQAIKIAMDNVSFAMDSMVTNLREGVRFGCNVLSENCTEDHVMFIKNLPNTTQTFRYKLVSGTDGLGHIQFSKDSDPFVDITSSEVDIKELMFYVPPIEGSEKTKITIVIIGEVHGKTSTKFNIQTTVKTNF